jgi:hypothetical protein
MIMKIEQPSMACNAKDVHSILQFENTMEVAPDMKPEHVLSWAAQVAKGAPSRKWKALAINCHGAMFKPPGGKCSIGGWALLLGTGISSGNVKVFSQIADCFDVIYLVACGAAGVSIRGGATIQGVPLAGDGEIFCGQVASLTRARVIAPEEVIVTKQGLQPFGVLEMNGPLREFEWAEGTLRTKTINTPRHPAMEVAPLERNACSKAAR